VARIGDMVYLLDQFGFAPETRWRSQVRAECVLLAAYLGEQLAPLAEAGPEREACEALAETLQQLAKDIDLFSARQMMTKVHALLFLAEDVDHVWGARAKEHRARAEEWDRARREFKAQLAGQVRAVKVAQGAAHAALGLPPIPSAYPPDSPPPKNARAPEHFGLTSVPAPAHAFAQGERSAVRAEQERRKRTQAMYAAADELLCVLEKLEELPVTQHTEREAQAQYLQLLRRSAQMGVWHVAFAAYNSMRAAMPRLVAPETYSILISACKHGSPPSSLHALQVLHEMTARGFKPKLAIFNQIIDACVPMAEFRLAARVVRLMAQAGVGATANTYDTLDRVCRNANARHAPDVYDALKLAGVPEAIAFACAQTCSKGAMQVDAHLLVQDDDNRESPYK
jgi:hypothetical protein